MDLELTVTKRPRRWMRMAEGAEPPPMPGSLPILPRRWLVERAFAWPGRNRLLSRGYGALPEKKQAWIRLAMIRLMVARLVKS